MTPPIETLGQVKTGFFSSQPVIKSGPNRGRRSPERGGAWIYMGGYAYEELQSVRSVHYGWAANLSKMGFRIGTHDVDGVRSFYVFRPETDGEKP